MQINLTKNENLSKIGWWQENFYFASFIALVSILPFSEALVSIMSGVLFGQAILMRLLDFRSKNISTEKYVLFPILVFAIYLIGSIFTHKFSFALYELKKMIFWLILPIAVYLSPNLTDKKLYTVLVFFIVSVLCASFFITSKIFLIGTNKLADFRSVSIVSHIRFSMQVVMAIIILSWFYLKKRIKLNNIHHLLFFLVFIWLVFFLLILKSFIGIIAFLSVSFFAFILLLKSLKNRKLKVLISSIVILILIVPVSYVIKVACDFYDFKDLNEGQFELKTASGNFYEHDFKDKTRENGYLVYVYICHGELRKEWNKRSSLSYDEIVNDNPLYFTILRYMSSLGLRKDSAGFAKLTETDIKNIESGFTNYKFRNHAFSIYPRIYEIIWEFDYYLRTGDPNNKTLSQRIEFAKASVYLIKQNPLFGIGTGNYQMKYCEAYDNLKSRLQKDNQASSHNQYLNYMVKFGVVGFLAIMVILIVPVFKSGNCQNYILVLFLISYAFACFGDSNLETHMGLSFFIVFYSLLIHNSTREMKLPVI